MITRQEREANEAQRLAPYAVRAVDSHGRKHPDGGMISGASSSVTAPVFRRRACVAPFATMLSAVMRSKNIDAWDWIRIENLSPWQTFASIMYSKVKRRRDQSP